MVPFDANPNKICRTVITSQSWQTSRMSSSLFSWSYSWLHVASWPISSSSITTSTTTARYLPNAKRTAVVLAPYPIARHQQLQHHSHLKTIVTNDTFLLGLLWTRVLANTRLCQLQHCQPQSLFSINMIPNLTHKIHSPIRGWCKFKSIFFLPVQSCKLLFWFWCNWIIEKRRSTWLGLDL